jgi:hypothetical protein
LPDTLFYDKRIETSQRYSRTEIDVNRVRGGEYLSRVDMHQSLYEGSFAHAHIAEQHNRPTRRSGGQHVLGQLRRNAFLASRRRQSLATFFIEQSVPRLQYPLANLRILRERSAASVTVTQEIGSELLQSRDIFQEELGQDIEAGLQIIPTPDSGIIRQVSRKRLRRTNLNRTESLVQRSLLQTSPRQIVPQLPETATHILKAREDQSVARKRRNTVSSSREEGYQLVTVGNRSRSYPFV